jgi:prepilin-type N-terminal cleavage/methylation domain-containing protein
MMSRSIIKRQSAFTLIELMLVVVIIGVATAVAVPRFAASMKGARLRSAARTISMVSRYARSTAVLHQKDMAVIFYPDRHEVELVSFGRFVGAADQDRFLDSRDNRAVAGLLADKDEELRLESEGPRAKIESELIRELPEGVEIDQVKVGGDIVEFESAYVANFFANGMCDAFTLFLLDEDERGASITVDALSGKVTLEYAQRP